MTSKPEVLVWPGAESMTALKRALREQRGVVLVLSTGLHHTFIRTFKPHAPPSELKVNIQGGAELIGRLTDIAGLEPLGEVQPTLRKHAWRIHITSPTPRVSFVPPA